MTKEMTLDKKQELVDAIGVSVWLHRKIEADSEYVPESIGDFWLIAEAGAVLMQYEPALIESLMTEALRNG